MLRISICLVLIVPPGQTFAAPTGLPAPDPDAEWWAALILLMNVRFRPWAIECIPARRQRKQKQCVRRVKRNRRRWAEAVAWQRLKPVLEEIVQDEVVRETTTATEIEAPASGLADFSLPVQIVVVTPDYSQTVCSKCGGPTKHKRSYYSHPQDIDLEQPTILRVYREIRECRDQDCKGRTAPELDFVAKGGRFTKRAKRKVIDSDTIRF